MNNQRTDFDSPWKEMLERYFEQFMAFFFPEAFADIDWQASFEFLDAELQQVVRDAELGRRYADKLVKVRRKDGEETWVLVHIEVQGWHDQDFPERMFVYNYRIYDRYQKKVASLAILADEHTKWRPDGFAYSLWGCEIGIRFPIVKLLDLEADSGKLEAHAKNPFSVVVETHLRARATHKDPENRLRWKLTLAKGLYKRGYSRDDILELFRFIDWIMILPEDLDALFREELTRYEEEQNMPYVTSVERAGIKKGIQLGIQQGVQQGIQQGIQQGMILDAQEMVIQALEARFEGISPSLVKKIKGISSQDLLKRLHRQAIKVANVEEFTKALQEV